MSRNPARTANSICRHECNPCARCKLSLKPIFLPKFSGSPDGGCTLKDSSPAPRAALPPGFHHGIKQSREDARPPRSPLMTAAPSAALLGAGCSPVGCAETQEGAGTRASGGCSGGGWKAGEKVWGCEAGGWRNRVGVLQDPPTPHPVGSGLVSRIPPPRHSVRGCGAKYILQVG